MHCFTDSCLSTLNTLDDVNVSICCTLRLEEVCFARVLQQTVT